MSAVAAAAPRPMRTIGLTIAAALAVVASVGGLARLRGPAADIPASSAVDSRALLFADTPDGAIAVTDAVTGRQAGSVTGEAGFLRPLVHGLMMDRVRGRLDRTQPLQLTRWADGRLTLDDPETGRHIELEAFGPTNEGVFAAFLDPQ